MIVQILAAAGIGFVFAVVVALIFEFAKSQP
jgi:hypothetical protein